MARQTEQVFENLRAILEANGASFRDVVRVGSYQSPARGLRPSGRR
jgi:enamine deaminase RidA (YjgF/YER057c/UK114 family)